MISLTNEKTEDERIRDARMKNPIELAFVGDSVYELLVRNYISSNINTSPNKLHRYAVEYVRAEAQCFFIEKLMDELTEDEVAIVKRGRNASKTSVPKHADAIQYRMSTGFEALFGYLYLIGREERIKELFRKITEMKPLDTAICKNS